MPKNIKLIKTKIYKTINIPLIWLIMQFSIKISINYLILQTDNKINFKIIICIKCTRSISAIEDGLVVFLT